jgi:hypothetical protein
MAPFRPQLRRLTKVEGDYWAIADKESLTNEIISRVIGRGGQLLSLTPRRESLEDYFIREIQQGSKS